MMKNQQTNYWMMRLLVVLVAIGFYSTVHANRAESKVEIRLNDQHSELDIDTKGKCVKKNHKGCIDVAKGTQARFEFKFVGSKTCNLQGGKKWLLGEVYLGGKNSP
ncbi:MAG: hypothetical protein GY732_12135, partial [Gammaproteobacteria bacterium]|nr:hypothetical protein [Gammaproteobacteria bacterium]